MPARNMLTVTVTQLLEHPGTRRHLSFDETVEGLSNELVRVEPTDPVHFDLDLDAIDQGSVYVTGTVSGRYTVACRRCLEEFGQPFDNRAAEVYRPRGGEVWEEDYVIVNEEIDLAPLVRDSVLLEMPLYPLCREDCAGLCGRCGGNRNRGECSCGDEPADDRWSALRGLLPRQDG